MTEALIEPLWTTALPDWEKRLLSGGSLLPVGPLFPNGRIYQQSMRIFNELHLVDVIGRPTIEEACRPWIKDFSSVVFGSLNEETGRRLIRYFMLHVSKKNSKSTIAAGIMLVALLTNWRDSGEFYILAPTIEVANNSFFPARDMIKADPELDQMLHIIENQRLIKHRTTNAFLKIVAADNETVSGKKTIGLLVDELWLFGKRAGSENMLREAMGGLASRPEGFVIYLTTQSDVAPAGVFKKQLERFRLIRDGKTIDKRSLGVIYEFPDRMLKDQSYKDPKNWVFTNPNLGASVDMEYLLEQYAENKDDEASFRGFAAKHLNVQIDVAMTVGGWAGAQVWHKGGEPGLTIESLLARSEVAVVGIDGGGLDDLLGVAVIGREKETDRWLCWTHTFVSPIGVERRKSNKEIYEDFQRAGDLTIVEKLPDDLAGVVKIVVQVLDSGLLAKVGVDILGIAGIVDALDLVGVNSATGTLTGVRQGIALMGAIKTVERKIEDGTFRHAGQASMAWQAGNAKVQITPTAMRIVRDEGGAAKVDTLLAMFDAAQLMGDNPEPRGEFQMMIFGEEMPTIA